MKKFTSPLSYLKSSRYQKPATGLEASSQDDDPVIMSNIRGAWPDDRPLETLEDYEKLLADSRPAPVKTFKTTKDDTDGMNNEIGDEESAGQTYEVLNTFLSNNLELSDIDSDISIPSQKEKQKEVAMKRYGSVFEQIRTLPRASTIFPPVNQQLPPTNSTTNTHHKLATASTAKSASDSDFLDKNTLGEQRDRNYELLRAWTDDGKYSRLKAMTIASTLYNSKVTDAEIRGELTPKEKFAYKRFCWELEEKLDMITKEERLSERALRKVWHLYALYTKALSDEIWHEGRAKSDITSRAIAYLVKRSIAGPDFTSASPPINPGTEWNLSLSRSKTGGGGEEENNLKPADAQESMNPMLAKCLNDPVHGFLVVFGRFVATGKVNSVDKLRKLQFNTIAEAFFDKCVEPPIADEIDALLLQHHSGYRRYRRSGRNSSTGILSIAVGSSSYCGKPGGNKEYSGKDSGYGGVDHDDPNSALNIIKLQNPSVLQQHSSTNGNVNLNDMKSLQRKLQMLDGKKRICLVGCRYDVLPQVAKEVGFEVVGENELWNINWSDSPLIPEKIMEMRRIQDTHSVFWGLCAPLQKTNHFPGMYEICRKDRLGRNLNRLKKMFPSDYNFFPPTWDLPTEQADLLAYSRKRKNLTFIVKPESGCQGKGIFLIRNLKNLYPFAKCVCQLYVPHPFLLDGYKFDQRIYVLITCVDPLRLYIYDEGIARFATVKYNVPTDDNLEVVFMHLTNYSLNKFSESYVPEGDGSKRKLSSIYQWMADNNYDVTKLVRAIDEIVVKTLLCAAPTLKHNYKTSFPKKDRGCSCFELLGFDILIDRHMKPILLEVNHSPSFNLDLPVDAEVKTDLLKDLLNMVYVGEELSAQVQAIQKRKGKLRKKENSPPPSAEMNGLPKTLMKQFQHEMTHKGKFRLIYSSDKPGKYTKLVDEHYCGYMAQENVIKRKPTLAIFENDGDPNYWQPRETSSVMKVTKSGQMYVETRVVTPPIPSQLQKFREIPEGERAPLGGLRRKRTAKGSKKTGSGKKGGKESQSRPQGKNRSWLLGRPQREEDDVNLESDRGGRTTSPEEDVDNNSCVDEVPFDNDERAKRTLKYLNRNNSKGEKLRGFGREKGGHNKLSEDKPSVMSYFTRGPKLNTGVMEPIMETLGRRGIPSYGNSGSSNAGTEDAVLLAANERFNLALEKLKQKQKAKRLSQQSSSGHYSAKGGKLSKLEELMNNSPFKPSPYDRPGGSERKSGKLKGKVAELNAAALPSIFQTKKKSNGEKGEALEKSVNQKHSSGTSSFVQEWIKSGKGGNAEERKVPGGDKEAKGDSTRNVERKHVPPGMHPRRKTPKDTGRGVNTANVTFRNHLWNAESVLDPEFHKL